MFVSSERDAELRQVALDLMLLGDSAYSLFELKEALAKIPSDNSSCWKVCRRIIGAYINRRENHG